ncbi:16S rRNA (adenine(1518)-N(6)/adenine(1519)-N(6))-dimethyltransferase RsmA [Candidatus Pelagibacter sp.]|nr:16S rRNA (adenine(1518)-N(6)/adenine(1519)-N(6))-dimethyltransferase RsmA [Candidatus Pelagibacter sp.]
MIKAKKSLGQNFLIDRNIIDKITSIVEIKNKSILEIGPGTGNLTSSILKKDPKKILVVEKDDQLVKKLEESFSKKITIINKDILNLNENLLSKEELIVFGNLPYNISTEILCKWILNLNDNKIWFKSLILMFQKEVADRIISNFNTSGYGRLSILTNWKLNVKKVFDIKPNCFLPKPKIDSTLLFFTPKKDFLKLKNPLTLEKITRIFFSNRRKMIKKPFKQLFSNNSSLINELNINLNLRPQNLSFETYYKLAHEYEKLIS